MDFAISIPEGTKITALNKALAAYNMSHHDAPLSATQFVQKMIDGQVESLVGSYLTTTVSRRAFMERFTAEERVAIRSAAQVNPAMDDYLQMLNVSEQVDLTYPLTVAGVQQLEAAGLLGQGRAAEILAL